MNENNMFTPIPKSNVNNQKKEIENIREMMKSIQQFNEQYYHYLDCLGKTHNLTETFDTTDGPTVGPTYGSTVGPTYGSTIGPTYGSTVGPTYGSTVGPTYGSTRGPTSKPNDSVCVMPTIPKISKHDLQTLNDYHMHQDAIYQYNKNISKIRNELDSKLDVLYNTNDSFLSDYQMEFNSTIYTGILWSILAGSLLYYIVTRE
jgi:hypothetical protein